MTSSSLFYISGQNLTPRAPFNSRSWAMIHMWPSGRKFSKNFENVYFWQGNIIRNFSVFLLVNIFFQFFFIKRFINKFSISLLKNCTAIFSIPEYIDFLHQRRYRRNSGHSRRRNFLIKFFKTWDKILSMIKFSEDDWSPIENIKLRQLRGFEGFFRKNVVSHMKDLVHLITKIWVRGL